MRLRLRDEEGIALVLALIVLGIMSLTTAALITGVTNNHRTARSQSDADKAFALAELGLSYAEGVVYSADSSHQTPPSGTQTVPTPPTGGTATYSTSAAADGVTWTMTGTGTVNGVSRTVSAQANVPGTTTVTNTGVWNYLYADSVSGSCPTNISGGVTVSVPMLTRGNLCLVGGSHYTGSQLEINGSLSVTGGSNVGTSAAKVATVKVAGTCTLQTAHNGTQTVTAGTSYCDGTQSPVFATSIGTTLDVTPQMPSVDFAGLYSSQAALTKTGCPANLLDNDTTLNNSLTSAVLTAAMFPNNSSYDCKVGTANEIKWTNGGSCGSATLFIKGEILFDGSLNFGCGFKVVYSGQASLWFTGSVTIGGGNQLCGIASCTTSWNPDVNGLIMVVDCWKNSNGTQLVTPACVNVTGGSKVQVGFYTTTDYTIAGGSTNMGPVLSGTLTLSGGSSTLIPFHSMPPGTPLNSQTTYIPASPPTTWGG